jgi:hypothetical protein
MSYYSASVSGQARQPALGSLYSSLPLARPGVYRPATTIRTTWPMLGELPDTMGGLGFSLKPPKWLRKAAPTILKVGAIAAGAAIAGPAVFAAGKFLVPRAINVARTLLRPARPGYESPPVPIAMPGTINPPLPVPVPQAPTPYPDAPAATAPGPDATPIDTRQAAGFPSWAIPAGLALLLVAMPKARR